MAKCQLLYQENEELGKIVNNGHVAKLEGELALQKNFGLEIKKSQSGIAIFLSIILYYILSLCLHILFRNGSVFTRLG